MLLAEKGNHELLELVQNVSNLVNVHYIRQKQPLGLGHAVLCASRFIGDEPFALLLGDDIIDSNPPCLKQMMDIYDEAQTSVIAAQTVPWEDVSKYGIISPSYLEGKLQYISDLIEKPDREQAPSNMAVIGRYVIEPEIFGILEHCQPGRGGEIQLTDALRILNQRKPMIAYIQQGKRYDVGDKLGYIEATIEFALKRKDLQPHLLAYLKELMKQWM